LKSCKWGAVPAAEEYLKPLLMKVPNSSEMGAAFSACFKSLIGANGETAPAGDDDRRARVEDLLAEKRAKTFPLKGFDRKALAYWSEPSENQHEKLSAYIAERFKVDAETGRLAGLFREALALPTISDASASIDCPLCDTDDTLTPERIVYPWPGCRYRGIPASLKRGMRGSAP
jgi:hypothetical protein